MRGVAVLMALLALGTACRSQSVTLIPDEELPRDVYGSPQPTPPAEQLPETGPVYLLRQGHLYRVERPLAGTVGTLQEGLLLALLQGTEGIKEAATAIPPNTRLNDLEVTRSIAYVDLSTDFEGGASRRSQALRIAQVVYTLTSPLSGVGGVRFAIDGEPRQVIGGVNLTVIDRPVNRSDYVQFTRKGT